MEPLKKVNLTAAFARFSDYWHPRIAGECNGQQVKLVRFEGEFVWHHHDLEDELFLVVEGSFRMEYRDAAGVEDAIELQEGEFLIVPRGVSHRPVAASEVKVLLFEPASTVNTGNAEDARTRPTLERL